VKETKGRRKERRTLKKGEGIVGEGGERGGPETAKTFPFSGEIGGPTEGKSREKFVGKKPSVAEWSGSRQGWRDFGKNKEKRTLQLKKKRVMGNLGEFDSGVLSSEETGGQRFWAAKKLGKKKQRLGALLHKSHRQRPMGARDFFSVRKENF